MLFRPAGQKAFARAVGIMIDRGMKLERAVRLLSRTPLQLQKQPWIDVLRDPHGRRMIVRNQVLAQDLFLFMVGQYPQSKTHELLTKFRKATGDEKATLDTIKT